MVATSSSHPDYLIDFAHEGIVANGARLREAKSLSDSYWDFADRSRDASGVAGPPLRETSSLLRHEAELSGWTGDVGRLFQLADGRSVAAANQAEYARLTQKLFGWTRLPGTGGLPRFVGYNPMTAPEIGSFEVAGYGQACSKSTLSKSVIGPDGLTYPIVVPPAQINFGLTRDTLPGADWVDDRGRTWTTTATALVNVSEDPGVWWKLAGAAAFAGGYDADSEPVSSKKQRSVLEISPSGEPRFNDDRVPRRPSQPQSPEFDGTPSSALLDGVTVAVEAGGKATSGWAYVANSGTQTIQTTFQTDGKGSRRALVRGYRVYDDGTGTLKVKVAYWTGASPNRGTGQSGWVTVEAYPWGQLKPG
jgi:hypothetical protein